MRVFISWSGVESGNAASILKQWLPTVIQAIDPWMSEEDIPKGSWWPTQVPEALSQSRIAIVCLTRLNQKEPWILFEAGFAAARLSQSTVCPFLLDLTKSELVGPLSLLQATEFQKGDVLRLLKSINTALDDRKLDPGRLAAAFERAWPELEHELTPVTQRLLASFAGDIGRDRGEDSKTSSRDARINEVRDELKKLKYRWDLERDGPTPTRKAAILILGDLYPHILRLRTGLPVSQDPDIVQEFDRLAKQLHAAKQRPVISTEVNKLWDEGSAIFEDTTKLLERL